MKLITLLLPFILVGCATHIPTPTIAAVGHVINVTAVHVPDAPPEVMAAPVEQEPTVEAAPIPTSTIVDKVKTVVKIVKVIKQELNKPDEPPDEVIVESVIPGPKSHISATGAKLQVFGIDIEFWVGNDDSWSTVWKLIVLMLVVYGGLRFINTVFDRFKLKST